MKKVAIISDIHGVLEPLIAVLADIKKRGITEVYTLGDNIGLGPNPSEVLNLLEENQANIIRGEAEEICIHGINGFDHLERDFNLSQSYNWTKSKLNPEQTQRLKIYPISYELLMGGKKIGLCHFASDVRFEEPSISGKNYQLNLINPVKRNTASFQFYSTNTDGQRIKIENEILILEQAKKNGKKIRKSSNARLDLLLSAKTEPLFGGKLIGVFDSIIQGHIHIKYNDYSSSTMFHNIHSLIGNEKRELASYIILTETVNGYSLEEIFVEFDFEKMISVINESDMPIKSKIKKIAGFKQSI